MSRWHLVVVAAALGWSAAWAQPEGEKPAEDAAETPAEAKPAEAPKSPADRLAEEAEAAKREAAEAAEDEQPAAEETEQLPAEIAELVAEYEYFAGQNGEYRADLDRVLKHQYNVKRRAIQGRYRKVVDELTAEERRRRDDAIAQFEEFLRRYPNNPKYTPDALFRLAELHFEKSNDAYVTALEEFEEMMETYDEARDGPAPPDPQQDYTRTIALFEQLIRSWPQYRNIDGAYYLKGYCLIEMGKPEQAMAEFNLLVQKYPESRFVPETWTRIGEHHFDNNDLPKAIGAYLKVLEHPDSPYYDKALYKLAWTYYRNDQYEDSIARFRELIEYSDEQAKKTGLAGSELRAEALQYLAISIQEEDWDGDGVPDAGAGFDRVLRYVDGNKAYDVEVLRALADIFFDNAKYPEAIATVKHLHQKFPNHEANPELHGRLITAYERMQQFDKAFAERDALARAYGDGSDWRAANEDKPDIIAAADEMIEDALIQAATYHHTQAQQLREKATQGDISAEDKAIKEYRLAASAYDNYLKKYPGSDNAYQLRFFYAECLYYSFRFLESAEQYAQVRDSSQGDKYREVAGFSTILAHENSVKNKVEAGELPAKATLLNEPLKEKESSAPVPDAENDGTVKEISPETIPEPVLALLKARKTYIDKGLNSADDPGRLPKVIYKTGEVYFDYKHFEEARRWFALLVKEHPKQQVAEFAAGNIIETYRQANDWEKMAEWAEIVSAAGLGKDISSEIQTLKVGALFKSAERLFQQEKYEKAAEEYVRLLKENPNNRFADAALNNAAVAFEKTRRFESASRMYERLYAEHPDSPYAEGALFRIGVNAERFYNYDKAIDSHLELVGKYQESEKRPDSLYPAALLPERTQQYRKAATNYERYAQMFPDRKDTADTYYRAAEVYEKLGDERNQVRIYDTFINRYGSDPKYNALVIESLAKKALINKKKNRKRATRQAWEQVINEFNRRGMQPGTFEARYPAQAQFELVENDFKKYQALKLTGSLQNQTRVIKVMQRKVKELSRRYAEVLPYKSFDWTLAAFYRLGHIYQLFAEALYDAPIPSSFSVDEEDVYRTQLEDIAVPIEDEAVKRYEEAYAKAREFRITNEWTKRILSSLNKYKPADYPLFKEEQRIRTPQPLTPPQLLTVQPAEDE